MWVDGDSIYVVDGCVWMLVGIVFGIDLVFGMIEWDMSVEIVCEVLWLLVVLYWWFGG